MNSIKKNKSLNAVMKLAGILQAAVLCLFLMPADVFANNQDVTITDASATGTSMTVSGTTDASAVAVQIRDSAGKIWAMGTLGVLNNQFSGTISNLRLSSGDYTIYVADYEGGTWTTAPVTVTNGVDPSKPDSSKSSSSKSSSSSSHTCKNHDYQYKILEYPTRTKDGKAAYVCTHCDQIDYDHPGVYDGYIILPSYYQFQKETVEQIQNAPAGEVTVDAEFWVSFMDIVYEEIEKRPDLTVKVDFTYSKTDYTVTIPAGTPAESILNGSRYAGFMYLGSLYGLTER